jgi:hypothetical protein
LLLRDLQLIDMSNPDPRMSPLDYIAIQVVELYLHRLGRTIRTDGIAKVNVELYPADRLPGPVQFPSHVATVRWPTNFEQFTGQDVKRSILDVFHEALLWMARQNGWDSKPLHKAYQASLDAGVVCSGLLLKKSVKHPKRKVWANCAFEYDSNSIHVYAVLFDRRGTEIGRKYVYKTGVIYDAVRHLLERLIWLRGTRLRMVSSRAWDQPSHDVDVSEILKLAPAK